METKKEKIRKQILKKLTKENRYNYRVLVCTINYVTGKDIEISDPNGWSITELNLAKKTISELNLLRESHC